MAVCLVTHNTGIAQSSPDPFLCDTRWSQFSALFMHGRRRRRKKKWETQTFCYSLWWKLIPPSLPFQIWQETLQKEVSFFLSYLLHCCASLPRHQYRGQVLLVLSLRNQEMWIPPQKPLRKWQVQGWGATPHSAHSTEKVRKRKCGSKTGRDMIRQEKALGEGGKKKGAQVNKKQREAGSFFLENFNWLLGFSSTQLACLLHANTRS